MNSQNEKPAEKETIVVTFANEIAESKEGEIQK